MPRQTNAAPEWQARSPRWRSREMMVACPLEGLVLRLANFMEHIFYISQTREDRLAMLN
jgi:hypothetical protein